MIRINRWNWQWERLKNEEKKVFLDWIYPTKLKDYKGKLVLDAGCGNGGYSKMVADYAKKVVALDKYSIESARKNVKNYKNIEFIKGDIESFKRKEKFDAIFCVGVLHHLKDPKKGFLNLLSNLKTGGFINIWVYGKEGNWLAINILEQFKKYVLLKLPLPILKILAHILVFILTILVWTIYLLPLKLPYGSYLRKLRYFSYSRKLMNTFDKLNASLTHWISREDIKSWFKDLDKVRIRNYNNISWSGFGIKR